MSYLYRLRALVFIAAISSLFYGTKADGSQGTHMQSVSSAPTKLGPVIDAQGDIETLIQDLFASIEDGSSSYDSIRIVSQIGRLGTQASPAVDILIDLLGKPFADCDEGLRVCSNNTPNCVKESRICPPGAEMRNYDYLTPYAFAALQQIGVAALPKLSVALDDGTLNEESLIRRRLAAGVMGSIGPAAIPFLSDILRVADYSKKRLALGALYTVLSKDPSSGYQLTSLVPYITPFLNGDFETTDQAIYVLGAIGPGAAEAVPRLTQLLSYQRVLPDRACPVGERTGYIFQSGAIDALLKIGTPEAMRAVEQYKVR
ncbi:MAG TPA: hypothetical protein VJ023_03070 [Pyrinomonadaceae bacterium]|nr:hypothetical protein [Pyrinomonadaceae bacterium]